MRKIDLATVQRMDSRLRDRHTNLELNPGEKTPLGSMLCEWGVGGSLTTVYIGVNQVHKTGLSTWRWKRAQLHLVVTFTNEVSKALLEKVLLTSKKSYITLSTRKVIIQRERKKSMCGVGS